MPTGLTVDGTSRHDMRMVRETIDSIPIDRPEPKKRKPRGMCLDKGCDCDDVREVFAEFGFTAHIRSCGEGRGPSRTRLASRRDAGRANKCIAGSTASGESSSAGREIGELHRPAASGLCDHRLLPSEVIQIGSYCIASVQRGISPMTSDLRHG